MKFIEKVYAQADEISKLKLNGNGNNDINLVVDRVIAWILYFAGVLAFIYLVLSGIKFITAGGNSEQAAKGKAGIVAAAIGIIVIALSFAIIRAVGKIGLSGPK